MKAEIHYDPDGGVRLLVPPVPGLVFADVAPKLEALAERLRVELKLPVRIEVGPEQHTHGPDGSHIRVQGAVGAG